MCGTGSLNYTWRGKKAYQVKKSKFFVFVFFVFQVSKLNWEIQNNKKEKEMGRKEKRKTTHKFLTQLGGAHHSESGWIM